MRSKCLEVKWLDCFFLWIACIWDPAYYNHYLFYIFSLNFTRSGANGTSPLGFGVLCIFLYTYLLLCFIQYFISYIIYITLLCVRALKCRVNYNPGHNILELYSILVQVRFTTSKTKLDIYYSKLGIRVAERLKTREIRKY